MIEETILHNEMQRTIGQVWKTALGVALSPSVVCDSIPMENFSLAGYVNIHGAWNGRLAVGMSRALIEILAVSLYEGNVSTSNLEDVCEDLLCEIANMIGGNLKCFLPEPCQMEVPLITHFQDQFMIPTGYRAVVRLCFECEGEPIMVTMFREIN